MTVLSMMPMTEPRSEHAFGVTPEIDSATFASIRRRMALDYCKWDPQVGDVSTLAPFALTISHATWRRLAAWSEQLATEAMAAEAELLRRPDLHGRLALPWRIRRALRRCIAVGPTPTAARTIRFDFHWTSDGWRISEANADVPGGFTEASSFTRLMAAACPGGSYRSPGDPAAAWADAIASSCRERANGDAVALLCAAGFMEDQQIVTHLAGLLRERGLRPWLAGPEQLRWPRGRAALDTGSKVETLSAIVRFYQAEWLAHLPRWCGRGWENLFGGSETPVTNPGSALLIESKRFPLVWNALPTPVPTWRRLFPETRDPREAPWPSDDRWLLKTAMCNTGDTVSIRSRMTLRQWRAVRRGARWKPGSWVAQRVFRTIPVWTPMGVMYPCVGVHTIDGRAAGAYVRLSPGPVIDFAAVDVALLIDDDAGDDEGDG